MQPIPYTLTNDSVTVIVDGAPKVIRAGTAQFQALRQALFAGAWDEAREHLKKPDAAIATYLAQLPDFALAGDQITFKGEPVAKEITARAGQMVTRGESPLPLLRFYERLQRNPSMRSVEQLYPFLSHQGIPIEEDGTFLAYKGVREDLLDQHSASVDNTPGVVNKMPRNKISDDPNHACHYGYHVGALEYAKGFAPRVVICRVDPEHVVCIPYDCGQQKMRVCEYEVIGFWNGQEHLPSTTSTEEDLELGVDEIDDGDADTGNDFYAEGDEGGEGEESAPALTPAGLTLAEMSLIERGETIAAIKAIRERLPGTGLKDAKFVCDEYKQEVEDKANGPEPAVKRRNYRNPVGGKDLRKLARMTPKVLLTKATLDQLRAYAAKLKIVGASKIAGGKVGLIKHIVRARKRR